MTFVKTESDKSRHEMGDSQKSIVSSTTENLDITFPSGENLSITKTKHSVTLNLQLDEDNKNSYSDETPTPTRFIRNCEEVGLFQDLQNVNPFDETFKKAVELVKTGSLHVPESSTDDTLHTPHILPHEENANAFKQSEGEIFSISRVPSLDEDLLKLGTSKEVVGGEILDKLCGNKETQQSLDSSFSISRVPSIDEDLLIIANDDSDSEKEVVSNKNKENKQQIDSNKALKMRIKEAVQSRLKNETRTLKLFDSGQGIIIAPVNIDKIKNAESATLLINRKPEPSIIRPPRKRSANSQPDPSKKSKTRQEENVSPKKEKTREMNRLAQSRSRTRKKHWINEMQKQIENLKKENKILKTENEVLRNEIGVVKNVLQFHTDCSAAKDPEISKSFVTLKLTIISVIISEKKIEKLHMTKNQKPNPPSKKNPSSKTKTHVPIRPHPIHPISIAPLNKGLSIEMPVVQAVPNNVVCVVPALTTRPVLQVTTVVEGGVVKPVLQVPQ